MIMIVLNFLGCAYKNILSRNSSLELKVERQKETIRCLKKKLKALTKTIQERNFNGDADKTGDSWSEEELANCLMLKSISERAYNFLRKKQVNKFLFLVTILV